MALQHLRSSTANKRATPAAMSDGQLAMNTNSASPGLFLKDNSGALVKVGPVHVGTTAPNASPASGGQTGNSVGEQWLDTTGGTYVFKVWDGSAWRSEAGEFVNASGDTMTGALVMDNQQQVRFRETTANGTNYIALQAPASVASDKTITLPDVTGTVVTTGDTGSVTSTMIADSTIVDGDISASAEIAVSKLADGAARQLLQTDAAGTGVEWTSNIDVPGTLDVTSTATFDSIISASAGAAATPSITFTGDTNTGIYSPGADQVAISSNSSERIRIGANGEIGLSGANYGTSGQVLTSAGSGAAPTWTTPSAGNTDKIEEGNSSAEVIDTGSDGRFVVTTEGSERLRVDSSGRLGLGTSAPSDYDAGANKFVIADTTNSGITIRGGTTGQGAIYFADGTTGNEAFRGRIEYSHSSDSLNFGTAGTGYRVTLDSSGRLGIGTTSPSYLLHVNQSPNTTGIFVTGQGTSTAGDYMQIGFGSSGGGSTVHAAVRAAYNNPGSGGATSLQFFTNNNSSTNEAARIDSSGRLLVGTSTARTAWNNTTIGANILQVERAGDALSTAISICANPGTSATETARLLLGRTRGNTVGATTIVASGDVLGLVSFQGSDGTEMVEAAEIAAVVDGTPGANDMPGRLVFSTTADGASSPTERLRITCSGSAYFNTTNASSATVSNNGYAVIYGAGSGTSADFVGYNDTVLGVNRTTSDGTLISLRQDGTTEGTISVSGTTVSYNGAHLSRWSQLVGIDPYDKTARPEILRGTVMSNLDEMCDWTCPTSGDCQDNEQLNKTEISSVDDDPNVAGVFQSWDDDDDTWVNDYHLAMTGDFVIRIAAGTTVQRGDLLCSAGDGTAKPQGDDIIRSKTIAKVTSTVVSCTHPDGSYCVPCVLMAC